MVNRSDMSVYNIETKKVFWFILQSIKQQCSNSLSRKC